MPTYLVHGFRWPRWAIRIYIARYDLDDAAAEWLIAPATSVTLLNSFYTQFDCLPPSNPPPPSYAFPAPHEEVVVQEAPVREPQRRLTKKNTSSRTSLRSTLSIRARRTSVMSTSNTTPQSGAANGQNGDKDGYGNSGALQQSPPSTNPSTSTSTLAKKDADKPPGFNDWSVVKIVEQYSNAELLNGSQPYAYVGDYLVEVPLGASITEEMGKYAAKMKAEEELLSPNSLKSPTESLSAREMRRKSKRLGWFDKLRDGVHKDAEIGWFVVVCDDEERVPLELSEMGSSSAGSVDEGVRTPKNTGLRKLFSKRRSIPEE